MHASYVCDADCWPHSSIPSGTGAASHPLPQNLTPASNHQLNPNRPYLRINKTTLQALRHTQALRHKLSWYLNPNMSCSTLNPSPPLTNPPHAPQQGSTTLEPPQQKSWVHRALGGQRCCCLLSATHCVLDHRSELSCIFLSFPADFRCHMLGLAAHFLRSLSSLQQHRQEAGF